MSAAPPPHPPRPIGAYWGSYVGRRVRFLLEGGHDQCMTVTQVQQEPRTIIGFELNSERRGRDWFEFEARRIVAISVFEDLS